MSKADWDKREKAQGLVIAEQRRDLARLEGELEKQRREQEKVKSRVKDKTKITSKKSAKAGTPESDSSDTPSLKKMYRASNKNPIVTPSHVSSSKSSRKEGSPAKKVKMDNFHSDHAGPSQVTSGQRHLTKTEMLANKGSHPPLIPPKKPTRQGTQSLDRLSSKSSFEQDLAKLDIPLPLADLRRKLGTKSPNPKIPMPVNPYALPPPPNPPL